MNTPVILQFVALAIAIVIGVSVAYLIYEMHRAHAEITSLLRTMESENRGMQKIAAQVETAVAAATETQAAAIEKLREHLDNQDQRLATLLESIADAIHALQQRPRGSGREQSAIDLARLRRDMLSQDPALRFSVLKDWASINGLAILHRASRGWKTPNDLVGNVPACLEPEAEILNDRILLLGTRHHSERLAIALGELDSASGFQQWFEVSPEGQPPHHVPAVLTGRSGNFELVSKGTGLATLTN
jgi:hypothetical protein